MSRSVTITVVTANIGRGVSTKKAHQNIHKVAVGFPGAFVGFQEIDEADKPKENTLVAERFPSDDLPAGLMSLRVSAGEGRYEFAGFDGPGWKRATPIAVPTTWTILRQSVRKSSDGMAHVTPNRVIVTARCRPADDPEFPPVIFLNGHYPLAHSETAQKIWDQCQASWTKRVNEIHDRPAGGATIITTRDSNHHGQMPKVHELERQLLVGTGIDRISVIEADKASPHHVKVRVLGRREVDLTIDGHNARAVDLRLTATNI